MLPNATSSQEMLQDALVSSTTRNDWYHLQGFLSNNPLDVLSGQAAKLPYMDPARSTQASVMAQPQPTHSHPSPPMYPYNIPRNPDFDIRSMFMLMSPSSLAPETTALTSLLNDANLNLPNLDDLDAMEKVIPGRTHTQDELDHYCEYDSA